MVGAYWFFNFWGILQRNRLLKSGRIGWWEVTELRTEERQETEGRLAVVEEWREEVGTTE